MDHEFDSTFSKEDMEKLIADLPNILCELEKWFQENKENAVKPLYEK